MQRRVSRKRIRGKENAGVVKSKKVVKGFVFRSVNPNKPAPITAAKPTTTVTKEYAVDTEPTVTATPSSSPVVNKKRRVRASAQVSWEARVLRLVDTVADKHSEEASEEMKAFKSQCEQLFVDRQSVLPENVTVTPHFRTAELRAREKQLLAVVNSLSAELKHWDAVAANWTPLTVPTAAEAEAVETSEHSADCDGFVKEVTANIHDAVFAVDEVRDGLRQSQLTVEEAMRANASLSVACRAAAFPTAVAGASAGTLIRAIVAPKPIIAEQGRPAADTGVAASMAGAGAGAGAGVESMATTPFVSNTTTADATAAPAVDAPAPAAPEETPAVIRKILQGPKK